MTQLTLSEPEVYPYTDYVVYMYSVIIINGDEISSEADIEKCTTYSDDGKYSMYHNLFRCASGQLAT